MDPVKRKQLDSANRKQSRSIIKKALLKHEKAQELTKKELTKIIKDLERGCNNRAIRKSLEESVTPIWWTNSEYCEIYSSTVYKLVQNLNPKSEVGSDHLIYLILNSFFTKDRAIKISMIADMHSNEMCPEKSQPIIQEHQKRLHKKIKVKTTNRYPCPKCGRRKATRQEKQLMSFDEGTNISLTCTYCNFHWIL